MAMVYLPDLMTRWFEGANPAPNVFEDELAMGRIRGGTAVHVRGRATISGTLVELWGPAASYTFPLSLAPIYVSSSDTADAWNGQGAQNVTLDGCGANYERYTEILNLSGTTVSISTGSFIRLNHLSVGSAGSHQSNRGQISGYHNGTLLIAQVNSGSGEDGNGVYTVPSGCLAIVRSGYIFSGIDAVVQARVQARPGSGSAWQNVVNGEVYRAETYLPFMAAALPSKTDIRISAAVTRAGSVSGGSVASGVFLVVFDPTFDDLEPK